MQLKRRQVCRPWIRIRWMIQLSSCINRSSYYKFHVFNHRRLLYKLWSKNIDMLSIRIYIITLLKWTNNQWSVTLPIRYRATWISNSQIFTRTQWSFTYIQKFIKLIQKNWKFIPLNFVSIYHLKNVNGAACPVIEKFVDFSHSFRILRFHYF